MKTITYIPQNENNNNLLATVTETNHATFSVSKDGVFNVVDNNQLNVGKGSTMKITIPKDELINIIVECSVIKHKNVKLNVRRFMSQRTTVQQKHLSNVQKVKLNR